MDHRRARSRAACASRSLAAARSAAAAGVGLPAEVVDGASRVYLVQDFFFIYGFLLDFLFA